MDIFKEILKVKFHDCGLFLGMSPEEARRIFLGQNMGSLVSPTFLNFH